jgi:hypothetical protein
MEVECSVCVRACVCVRARARVCVCVRVRACVCAQLSLLSMKHADKFALLATLVPFHTVECTFYRAFSVCIGGLLLCLCDGRVCCGRWGGPKDGGFYVSRASHYTTLNVNRACLPGCSSYGSAFFVATSYQSGHRLSDSSQ